MPLDPSIPLSVRPTQLPSVADISARIQQMKMQGLQQQAMQQQIESNDALEQERRQKVAAGQRAEEMNKTVDGLMANAFGEDGTFKRDVFEQGLAKSGQGHLYPQYAEMLDKLEQSTAKIQAEHRSVIARSIMGIEDAGNTPGAVMTALAYLKRNKLMENDSYQAVLQGVSADPSPQHIGQMMQQLGTAVPEYRDLRNAEAKRKADLAKTEAETSKLQAEAKAGGPLGEPITIKTMENGKPVERVITRAEALKLGSFPSQPPASTIINPQALTDVKETVAGMKDGTLPPMMPGRATKEYLATMAEAHRQGYDLQGAVTDWNATQKHIATLNGNQQTRLNQSINALPELLDSVEALAEKWKGGKFPVLNKANLALAKGGLYGSDVASVANQLAAQIADVNADLGAVYMGGNSPTDHALGLASKSLKGEWDEKVLKDMIGLARKNVTIRQNSIKHTGVQGASANNPYVPPAAPTPEQMPKRVYYDAQGNPK